MCTLSIVVAADAYNETPSNNQGNGHKSHIHYHSEYVHGFSQSHQDFNVWNALCSALVVLVRLTYIWGIGSFCWLLI